MSPHPHHDALIKIMSVMAAADGAVSDRELRVIADLVRHLPVFTGVTAEELVRSSQDAGALLADDEGLDRLVDEACAILPDPLRQTAYALAVEVAATDLRATQEELHLLEFLRDRLNLDPLLAAAIEASARVRFRRHVG